MIHEIDPTEYVSKQALLREPETITFADGSSCVMQSGRVIPLSITNTICLDGDWAVQRGQLLNCCDELIAADSSDWQVVQQPGIVCIADKEEKPRDIPNWHRRFMRHIPEDDVAVLKKEIRIPSDWQGRAIHLHVEGVYPAADIYVNGTLLAEHRSGLTPCSVACSDLVTPGQSCSIAIVIRRRYPLQEIDMPRHTSDYAGLHGSVNLLGLPTRHIEEHNLHTALDADLTTGYMTGSVRIHGAPADGELQLQIKDSNQSIITEQVWTMSSECCEQTINLPIAQPNLWCDETPNLYQATLTWVCKGVEQKLQWHCGFRRFEVIEGRPTVNGQPLKLRGVNHLTTHPEHGMHMPKSWLRRSLEMMKKANVNTIRTHLTGPTALAELCDEMGFYLMQEVTIDWYTHELGHPRSLGPCLLRIDGVLRRDRHHACLIALGIGNENLAGDPKKIDAFTTNFRVFYDYAKRLSPNTWVFFPPPGPANSIPGSIEPRMGDIADVHYNFATIRELNETNSVTLPESWRGPMTTYSREELLSGEWQGIWFSSEYGIVNAVPDIHDAPYQSVICEQAEDWLGSTSSTQALANRLEREWGLMRDDPTCLGGAYFPWLPPGTGDTWGWTFWAEDADWGVVTRDLTPKPQFWVLRAAYSPITFKERRLQWNEEQASITLTVRNRYSTIDLNQCTLRTQLGATGKFMGIMSDWEDIPAACPPGEDNQITIPLWNEQARKSLAEGKPTLLRLHVIDPHGFRPITHEVLLVPQNLAEAYQLGHINLGSDA